MKTRLARTHHLCIAALLLSAAQVAGAQNIYKCTKGAQLEYTDRPCAGGELIHQASDSEILDQYLDLGQDAIAERYADSHHLQGLYQQRLAAYQDKMQAQAQQQADEERQREQDAAQQVQLSEAAYRGRLQGENNALREQNQAYLDQLSQPPVYGDAPAYAPVYWGALSPVGNHDHDHDHDHDRDHDHGHEPHPPPPKPAPPAPTPPAHSKY